MSTSNKIWEFLLSEKQERRESSRVGKSEDGDKRKNLTFSDISSVPNYYSGHYNYIFSTNSGNDDQNGLGSRATEDWEFDDKNSRFYEFESSILPPLSTTNFLENIPGIGDTDSGGGEASGSGGGSESVDIPGVDFSVSWSSVIIMTMLVIITIVGNVLVCLSVVLVRKLRKPQNYLLVSLAVSDLFVAIFVMPFAILMEFYQSHWPLNSGLCDFWVSADVLCCTASILNLCAISLDRFQAITAPFDYSARSTPRRMLTVIFIVWLVSACVSLPPVLLLGNEYVDSTGILICSVSQNFWYQIYATMASFYMPLCVMVVVYAKILRVVTDKKKEMNWKKKKHNDNCTLQVPPTNISGGQSSLHNVKPISGSGHPSSNSIVQMATTVLNRKTSVDVTGTTTTIALSSQPLHSSSSSASLQSLGQDKTKTVTVKVPVAPKVRLAFTQRKSRGSVCGQSSGVQLPGVESPGVRKRSMSTCVERRRSGDGESDYKRGPSQLNKDSWDREYHSPHFTTPTRQIRTSLIPSMTGSTPNRRKNRLFSGLKEHKASTTLGIIMSAFIICWLPFFVLALVRPIFHVEIPDWISSLFNWLGYANSALNPVIYATLNRDFRRPFREILSFRCATLDSLMRKEFYLEQYGEDTDNPRNKASVTLIFLENGNISEPLL